MILVNYRENFNVDVPVDFLFSSATINEIADYVESSDKRVSTLNQRLYSPPFDVTTEVSLDFSVLQSATPLGINLENSSYN